MANNHKRKFAEYQHQGQRSSDPHDYEGVGQLLADLERPSIAEQRLPTRLDSHITSLDELQQETDSLLSHSNQWQMVGRKSKRKPKRKRAGDEKDRIKYPELTCHGMVTGPLRIADLQALILYTLADGVGPSWVAFKHSRHTRKVVVLMVPGLEKSMLDGTVPIEWNSGFGVDATPGKNGHEENSLNGSEQKVDSFHAWKHGATAKIPTERIPMEIKAKSLPQVLQPLGDIFEDVWPVKAPGDSRYSKLHCPIQAMLISPLPQSKENTTIKGAKPPAEEKDWRPQRTPITEFIHTADELREADYPLHPATFDGDLEAAVLEQERREKTGQNAEGGWVDSCVSSFSQGIMPSISIQQGSTTSGRTVYAVDCEMVLTSDDKYSLARISVVDWNRETTLDELVKPSLPVKNYFTQFSGMTSAILDPVQTTLPQIQSKLLQLFTPQSVLLGHSLQSDLAAMKMTHPFIIDTSLIYPHPRGPPLRSSLKFLAQKYLKREIQLQDSTGHNSVEDALAVLDLVKLKCEKGPGWGTSAAAGESIFRRLARNKKKDAGGNMRGITSAMVDDEANIRGYGKEATVQLACSSDREIAKAVTRAVNGDADGKVVPGGGVDFTWGRLRELESFRGWCNNDRGCVHVDKLHGEQSFQASAPEDATKEEERKPPTSISKPIDTAPRINATSNQPDLNPEKDVLLGTLPRPTLQLTIASATSHICAIHKALPPCTLFIIYTGTGDRSEVVQLHKMQQQFRKEFKVKKWDDLNVKWTDDEEQALKAAVQKAREGMCLMCVK